MYMYIHSAKHLSIYQYEETGLECVLLGDNHAMGYNIDVINQAITHVHLQCTCVRKLYMYKLQVGSH